MTKSRLMGAGIAELMQYEPFSRTNHGISFVSSSSSMATSNNSTSNPKTQEQVKA